MAYSFPVMKSLIAFFLLASPALAQMPPPHPVMPRLITVSGYAEAQHAPDRVILDLSLTNRSKDLSEAKRDNDQRVEKLVAITREFKIPKEKVSTSGVQISPEYVYENNRQRFIGYIVNRSVSITIDDLQIHERVLSAVVDAKIDQVDGIQFTLSNMDVLKKSVRAKAVGDARENAAGMAQAAGAKLGEVMNITTQSDAPVMYNGAPAMMSMKAERVSMDGESVAPSLPGLITLRETITASFALE